MKLEALTSLKGFIHAERYVNNPKYSSTAQYSEVSPQYHPRHGAESFQLPFFEVQGDRAEVFFANPSREAKSEVFRKNLLRFFVHPDALGAFPRFARREGSLRACPTSSTRTVLVEDGTSSFMLKLHLPKRISRFIRRFTTSSIRHSIGVAKELYAMTEGEDCPKEFAFLNESVGVSLREADAGFVLRELKPIPEIKEPRYLMPFFALYSQDKKSVADAALLTQIIDMHGKKSPLEFFLQHIFEPIIHCWAHALLRRGLLMESHGQNILLEVDRNFFPRRIVHRDFQSTPVDPLIRAQRGLGMPFEKHVIGTGDYPRIKEHSLIFDHFVADYLFTRFTEFLEICYAIHRRRFYEEARRIFRKYIDRETERRFFPAGHYALGHNTTGNSYELVYRRSKPLFRP